MFPIRKDIFVFHKDPVANKEFLIGPSTLKIHVGYTFLQMEEMNFKLSIKRGLCATVPRREACSRYADCFEDATGS